MLNVSQTTSLGFVRMRATSSNIVAWKVFYTITKTGSLSRAAIERDLSVSKLSRLLAQLEDDLGETLIDRSRHPLRPTAFGQKVLAKLKTVLPLWCEFEDFLNAEKGLHHVVRLSTPVGIGRFYLNKQLAEYHKIAPHIVIEASIEQGVEALLNHEVDVVFLPYRPNNPSLKIYPAMHAFTMPVASPEYLRRFGTPASPEDLVRHTLVLKAGENFPQATHLVLRDRKYSVQWKHVIFHHDMLNIKDAVVNGYGIALDVPLGMILDELRQKTLVPVLNGWHRDFWDYSIATRKEDDQQTAVGRFAAWYAKRATQEIDSRREEGFRILGVNPDSL